MFQRKSDKIFRELPKVFGIADHILIVMYDNDGEDNSAMIREVLKIYQIENFKLNKQKCNLRCMSIPFFREIVSRNFIKPDSRQFKTLTKIPAPKIKRPSIVLGIVNYLNKFFPRQQRCASH